MSVFRAVLCRAEYRLVAKKGEGTFSEVLKAQCIKNSKYVAIKCMKNHFDSLEQASWSSFLCTCLCDESCQAIHCQHSPATHLLQVNNLREIQALRRLSPHPNIIKLLEVL